VYSWVSPLFFSWHLFLSYPNRFFFATNAFPLQLGIAVALSFELLAFSF
jgi:hypothetical protein